MYKFVDTIEASESAILPSEALKINGIYIEDVVPGYRTLTVSGREALSPELDAYETGVRDGSVLKSKRYPARTITVQYKLIAESAEAFRVAYNKLAKVLDVENAELIFNDETDKFFTGTPSMIGEVEPGRNSVVGEFEIFCADPFKYSVEEYVVEATDISGSDEKGNEYAGKGFVFDYKGTYKSFPTLETTFFDENETSADGETETPLTGKGDCGYIAFFGEKGQVIQLGNPEELDGAYGLLPESQTLVSQNFNGVSAWGEATKKLWRLNDGVTTFHGETQAGDVGIAWAWNGVDTEYYLDAADYSIADGSSGPSITRTIPADASFEVGASDFTLTYSQKMAVGESGNANKEVGIFHALLASDSGGERKILAGVRVGKYWYGDTSSKIDFYVNGMAADQVPINLGFNNEYFGNDRPAKNGVPAINTNKTSIIRKSGNTVFFNIGGVKREFVCTDEGFAELKAKEITFIFSKYRDYNELTYNGLSSVKFVKNNCNTWKDTPNKFSSADVLVAKCRTGEVFLNNLSTPELGALGNDWEEFYLKPGVNQIGIGFSSWLSEEYMPTFKLKYREVFL